MQFGGVKTKTLGHSKTRRIHTNLGSTGYVALADVSSATVLRYGAPGKRICKMARCSPVSVDSGKIYWTWFFSAKKQRCCEETPFEDRIREEACAHQ